jgi:Secretion system C-terminal sorting domain
MKNIFLSIFLLFSIKIISQTVTLNVSKVSEGTFTVDVGFELLISPSITFYSSNFQILYGSLSNPTQVSIIRPNTDYTVNITNAGGLVLNCVVNDLSKVVSVGSNVLWVVRFNKGSTSPVTFAMGTVNECLNSDGVDFPALLINPQISFTPNTPLPLELISFQAQNTEGPNKLTWQTATETNTSHFDIERSPDGKTFEKIGETKAKGLNSVYQYVDKIGAFSTIYYRLKINDLDGKSDYSKVVNLSAKVKGFSAKVYPNPLKDQATIEITTEQKTDVTIELYDMIGRQVKRLEVENTEGVLTMPFDINDLSSGTFVLKVTDGVKTFMQKIIKD